MSADRAQAFARGAWACPACPDGWQCYMIATDMNVCAKCGYKGGPVEKQKELLEAARVAIETSTRLMAQFGGPGPEWGEAYWRLKRAIDNVDQPLGTLGTQKQ